MEYYGKILIVAIPIFLTLILFEKWYGCRKGKDTIRNMDMISGINSGLISLVKNALGLAFVLISYKWYAKHFALVHIKSHYWVYVIALLSLDFSSYWTHRIEHEINFFWINHMTHHSSEEYNLASAARQGISSFVQLSTFLLLPAALLGIDEKVIFVVAPFFLFAGFWYHTQHINKMGFLEKIIITPSHHRIHHAMNPEYIDKNYGQLFIFWDKLFGTYQEELPNVRPVYGMTRPAQTWNPIKINFQHAWLMTKDAWRTKTLKDKVRIWTMPTGWRPADVTVKYPIQKIDDVYHFIKYDTVASTGLKVWSWVQVTTTYLFILYLFGNITFINKMNGTYVYLYGAFIFLTVYSSSELMDRSAYAIFWELLKDSFGLVLIIIIGDWFGMDSFSPILNKMVIAYLILSAIVTGHFVLSFYKERNRIPNKSPTSD
ncbi:MAG TPA: sterol desaturase family protein [Puia sp.]